MSFRLSAKAKSDLENIARFTLNSWGREQRNFYLKQLDEAFHALADSPTLGMPCDYIKPGYRKFPQGSHVVYYRSGSETDIEIIRVLHKNMDLELNLNAP